MLSDHGEIWAQQGQEYDDDEGYDDDDGGGDEAFY